MAEPIRFVDMMERNDQERSRMRNRIRELEAALQDAGVVVTAGGPMSPGATPEEEELQDLYNRVEWRVVDPIFMAVSDDIETSTDDLLHEDGVLPSQVDVGNRKKPLSEMELEIAAVYGILLRDNVGTGNSRRFMRSIPEARGVYKADRAVCAPVLPLLVEAGDTS